MRGRGRARGRGQMRGGRNYSYNYNNKEDIHKIIEKDLNTEEIIEINVEEAKERKGKFI
jgi:predicted transcriptional regulator